MVCYTEIHVINVLYRDTRDQCVILIDHDGPSCSHSPGATIREELGHLQAASRHPLVIHVVFRTRILTVCNVK